MTFIVTYFSEELGKQNFHCHVDKVMIEFNMEIREWIKSYVRPMKVDVVRGSCQPLHENLVRDFDQLSSFTSKFPNEFVCG
jgi:hypothetical protein